MAHQGKTIPNNDLLNFEILSIGEELFFSPDFHNIPSKLKMDWSNWIIGFAKTNGMKSPIV